MYICANNNDDIILYLIIFCVVHEINNAFYFHDLMENFGQIGNCLQIDHKNLSIFEN